MDSLDLKNIPQDQLVAFYGLAFAGANADKSLEKEELMAIFEVLDLESLDEANKKIVFGYIINPPSVESCLEVLKNVDGNLKYASIVSVVEVLLADDFIDQDEMEFLNGICGKLNVNMEQKDKIIEFVKEGRRVLREGLDGNAAELVMKNASAGLAAVGVPIAAVYFSGTVIGLSAAGITSGLAALGLGLGMIPGIGVCIIIGTGLFYALKALFGNSRENKIEIIKENRERKIQMVIKNLQEAINSIIDRIKNLESKASTADANKEAILQLKDRLTLLQKALNTKRAVA
jgi:hypothetical protein